MNLDFAATAFAQTQEEVPRGTAPMWPMLLVVFAIFYFFILRPQQKKQKDSRDMVNTIAKGDRVVTIGGICGTIVNIKEKKDAKSDDDVIVLKVSDSSKIEMIRSSIARVLQKSGEPDESKD